MDNSEPTADHDPPPQRTASRLRFLKPVSAMARKSVAYREQRDDAPMSSPAAGITQNLEVRSAARQPAPRPVLLLIAPRSDQNPHNTTVA